MWAWSINSNLLKNKNKKHSQEIQQQHRTALVLYLLTYAETKSRQAMVIVTLACKFTFIHLAEATYKRIKRAIYKVLCVSCQKTCSLLGI